MYNILIVCYKYFRCPWGKIPGKVHVLKSVETRKERQVVGKKLYFSTHKIQHGVQKKCDGDDHFPTFHTFQI